MPSQDTIYLDEMELKMKNVADKGLLLPLCCLLNSPFNGEFNTYHPLPESQNVGNAPYKYWPITPVEAEYLWWAHDVTVSIKYGLQTGDCGLRTADYGLGIAQTEV